MTKLARIYDWRAVGRYTRLLKLSLVLTPAMCTLDSFNMKYVLSIAVPFIFSFPRHFSPSSNPTLSHGLRYNFVTT